MGWYIIIFWGGVTVKMWSLGLVIVCVSLVLWCTLCKCLVTSMWGCWVQNWYYPCYICAVFYRGGVILINFWWIKCYSISVLYFLLLEICTCGSLGGCFHAYLWYWKYHITLCGGYGYPCILWRWIVKIIDFW